MDKIELKNYFKSWRPEFSETKYFHLQDPQKLHSMKNLTYYGNSAARYIKELEAMIETMESYQALVFDRVQEVSTAPYHLEIYLTRDRRYDNKVKYYLTLKKVYDVPGIEPETVENTVYPGTERNKALKDFAAYQKSHPGIIAIKNIEKGRWEK